MHWKEVLGFWAILTTLEEGICTVVNIPLLENQPLGMLMCKQLCHKVSGCQTGFYDTYSLWCQIGGLQNHSLNSRNGIHMLSITRERDIAAGNITCPVGWMWMKTKAKIIQCIKYERKRNHHAPKISTKLVREDVGLSDVKYQVCKKLYKACENGKIKQAKSFLHKLGETVNLNVGKKRSVTSLDYYYILGKKCNLSKTTTMKDTLLHKASELGFIDIVRCVLLKGNVSVNARGRFGNTPIMLAARKTNTEVIQLLLKVGSSLSFKDRFGNNILHIAVQCGNLAAIKEIVSSGSIDINQSRGKIGLTPIMSAVKYGDEDAFLYLLSSGCNVTLVDKKGRNVLHLAALKNRVKLARYILSHHIVDKDNTDYSGQTALMSAASEGHYHVFLYLIHENCNPLAVDNDGNTVLHVACKGGKTVIVKTLLSHGGNSVLKTKNKEGKTPLDMVDRNRFKQLFDLISKG